MIVALIPARAGSRRVLGKNLRNVAGHPLLAWTVRAAVESERVDRVFVSSDSPEILEVAHRYGAEPLTRPAEYATDTASTETVIAHAASVWETYEIDWTACLLLEPTSPLRWSDRIDQAAALLGEHASVVTVLRDPGAYFTGPVVDGLYHPRYGDRPRTQTIQVYREAGGLYGFTRTHWERCGYRMGPTPAAVVIEPHEALDVNTEHDLVLADERCMRHQMRRRQRIPWPLPEKERAA